MDTLILSAADLAGDPAVVCRAEALRPAVEAASNEIEETRRLPPALLDRLHEARLFRLLLPRSSDGIETDPITFFHVIETIARGDASTAWCLSQAGGCAGAVRRPGRRPISTCRSRDRSSATIRAPCWPGAPAPG